MGGAALKLVFREEIELTDPRYSQRANLEYAVFKTREEVIQLEINPTTEDDYQTALEKFQYYLAILNDKSPGVAPH